MSKKSKERNVNLLKNINKNDYEKVEEVKHNEKAKGFYLGFSVRIILAVIIFFVFAITSCIFFNKTVNLVEEEKINYNEKGNIDYKVKLKNNNFYDNDYLEKNMSYVTNLIDVIKLNFKYNFKTDREFTDNYSYKVIGLLEIINNDNGELFFSKEYNLLDKKVNEISKDGIVINEELDVKYDYYNDIASSFKTTYGVNTDSKLKIRLEVSKNYSDELFNINDLNNTFKYDIEIPLSEKAISISIDSKEINNTDSIIARELDYKYNILCLVIALISLGITIGAIVYVLHIMNKMYSTGNNYDKLLKKILREYDRLIVNTTSYPDMDKCEVMKVSNFNELLDAKENLHKPIYYYEVTAHQKCIFFIKSEEVIVVYTLKAVDVD